MADEKKQTASPSEDGEEKKSRRPRLEVTPLGLRLPKAPPIEAGGRGIIGSVRLGWLRQLAGSIPRTMPDDQIVVFHDTHTEVRS